MKWGSRLVKTEMLASIALANSALLAVDVWVGAVALIFMRDMRAV